MKIFRINPEYAVICEWKKTRTAFKHEATLTRDGNQIHKTKICYLNRTWERYEFQSVIRKVLTGFFPEAEAKNFMALIDLEVNGEPDPVLKTVGIAAAFGEILCQTQEEKNEWKLRMLKAGLENRGLTFPDDFGNLPEDEKTRRLDSAISALR